jgi:hypothetical protein
MVQSMIQSGSDWNIRRIKATYDQLENKTLHELVTSSSSAALISVGISIATLSVDDPDAWNEIPSLTPA